jgi:hypothetical protein
MLGARYWLLGVFGACRIKKRARRAQYWSGVQRVVREHSRDMEGGVYINVKVVGAGN